MKVTEEGSNNTITDLSNTDHSVRVIIRGSNNNITIYESCNIRNMLIDISGDNNTLVINRRCSLRGSIYIRHGSKVTIGKCTSFVQALLFALEKCHLSIGEYCMFSSRVYIRTSDEHPIFDLKNDERINPAKDVIIGNKVWIGDNVTINKGVKVNDGNIIGACSVVLKSLKEVNSIYAGTPARLIRTNVSWDRYL
ncbi:acyltransferase [Ignatzschineria larvae DSM 13226]|uniref:Acyltransferase n=1 Tax=Ignatzschineria larvae DSM 13226 TaxID=1111732 RepID=A0ABZ3BY47_9GAMM|nr:acyltransferase [Ignatzschineria larvae]